MSEETADTTAPAETEATAVETETSAVEPTTEVETEVVETPAEENPTEEVGTVVTEVEDATAGDEDVVETEDETSLLEDELEELEQSAEELEALVAADPKRSALEIKALRAEAKANRERATELAEQLASIYGEDADEGFIAQWGAIGKAFADDPESVKPIFEALAGIEPAVEKSPQEVVEELFAKREAETARRQALALLTVEIKDLGYEINPPEGVAEADWVETPKAQDLQLLRSYLARGLDVKDAHAKAEAYKQVIGEAAVAAVRAAGEGFPPVASGTGTSSSGTESNSASNKESADPYDRTVAFYEEQKSSGGTTLNG
jgi:hypothetical protein